MNIEYYSSTGKERPNTKKAIILAPVMPLWDRGEFCLPLSQLLSNAGYEVIIIDTLSVCSSANEILALQEVEIAIKKYSGALPILLCGFALGGTFAQCLANRIKHLDGFLSVSGPGYATNELNEKLSSLINDLKNEKLSSAMESLYQWITPLNTSPFITPGIPANKRCIATERMLKGFSILKRLDSRPALNLYSGKSLLIVGELSQMANLTNQVQTGKEHHQVAVIKGAGMRPWNDNHKQSSLTVTNWIK